MAEEEAAAVVEVSPVDPNAPYFGGVDGYGIPCGPSVRLEYAAQFLCALITAGSNATIDKTFEKALSLADRLIETHNKSRNRKLPSED